MDKKLDKQTKISINYFKKTDTLKVIGGGILILALLCLWLVRNILGMLFAIFGTPAGLIMFLIGSIGRATDADMDSDIKSKLAGLQTDIDTNKHYQLRILKHIPEYTIEGYCYPENVMIKKLKDNSLRTSSFTRSKIKILKDSLYIISRNISLISPEVINSTHEIPYSQITNIEIFRDRKRIIFNNNTFSVNICELKIDFDGKSLSLPIINAVTSDELVRLIKKQMTLFAQSENNPTAP